MLNSNSDLYQYLLQLNIEAKRQNNKAASDRLKETLAFFAGGSPTEFLSDTLETLRFAQHELVLDKEKGFKLLGVIKQLEEALRA